MHNYILSSATRYVSKIILTLALMLAATQTIYADSMKLATARVTPCLSTPPPKNLRLAARRYSFPKRLCRHIAARTSYRSTFGQASWSLLPYTSPSEAALTEARHFMNRQPPLKNTDGTRCALKSRFRIDGKAFYMSYLVEGILNIPYALSLVGRRRVYLHRRL